VTIDRDPISFRRLRVQRVLLLLPLATLALPIVGHASQGPACEHAIAHAPSARPRFLKRDDTLIRRALPVLSEWSGDPAERGLLPDSRDTVGLHAMLDHLESAVGPRAPLALLSIVHWGYSGYNHLWQQGFAANVYVDAGFPLDGLEELLLDSDEIESARLVAFRALARSDTARDKISAARQVFVCRLAASLRDSASTDAAAGDLLTGALEELAPESIVNGAVAALLDDSSVARSAQLLVRGRRLPSNWRMAPTPPLELYLNSSAPGSEITLSIVATAGTVSIRTRLIRSIGDTIWAMTPAVVTIDPSARHVVIAAPPSASQLYGSFTYSWRSGTVGGNYIEVQHDTDAQPFAMTAAHLEITH